MERYDGLAWGFPKADCLKIPNKVAHIEAFYNILQDNCFNLNVFERYKVTFMAVIEFMDYYKNNRIHTFGFKNSSDFHKEFIKNIVSEKAISLQCLNLVD